MPPPFLWVLLLATGCLGNPETPKIFITPVAPTTTDELVAEIQGGNLSDFEFRWFVDEEVRLDQDSATVSIDWAWTVNGVFAASDTGPASELAESVFIKGDSVEWSAALWPRMVSPRGTLNRGGQSRC